MFDPRSSTSRRQFVRQLGLTAFAAHAPIGSRNGLAEHTAKAPTIRKDALGVAARVLEPLPLGSIQPRGWLKRQLEIQANGLSGHLDETWPDVGPNSGWLGGSGESWERGPYFLDGLIPLAYLLNDARLKDKAQRFIEWTIRSQTADGMFGPASNNDWWPRMVMLKALAQYYDATSDARVLSVMTRYFQYQQATLPARPLTSWGRFRWQDQALTALWLYDRTGDRSLPELVRLLHAQGYDWIAQYQDFQYRDKMSWERIRRMAATPAFREAQMATHGVNNAQAIKTGAIWSRVSGAPADRQAVQKMLAALDQYHGLPNGMFSCDEHLAGRNPSQGSELCTVVEYMFSLEQSLSILGEAAFGDRLEKLAFNALPGAMTDDMWAHQYDQQPNQVECSLHKEPWTTNGVESNLYGLEPHFGCCTANFHQGWPKFASSLFMTSDDGLAAVAFAPCELRSRVKGVQVHILEETEYPFRGAVRMTINPSRTVRFVLRLRIPAWAHSASIMVNGRTEPVPDAGTFAHIDRRWQQGDTLELNLPMTARPVPGYRQSVSFERGPLVFSYGIRQDWLKLRDRGLTADWQVYPGSRWNYAVAVNEGALGGAIQTVERPVPPVPFTAEKPAVELSVSAKLLPSWFASEGVAAIVPESPVESSERLESIPLVPYASAKLRITAFPTLTQGSAQIHEKDISIT